jgi:hypothetical protein
VSVRIAAAREEYAIATRRRLFVTVWREAVTVAAVRAVDLAISQLVREIGATESYGSVTVVERTMPLLMPDDAREASTALQRRWSTRMCCSGYLVEGTGFLPATVRTLTSGMHLVTRSSYPVKVFADPGLLASWLAPHVALTPADVQQTIAEARNAR